MKISPVQIYNPKSNLQHAKNAEIERDNPQAGDYRPVFYKPVFGSAARLNLNYILNTHSKELPERVLKKASEICELAPDKLPTLKDLHDHIYYPLVHANSLDEVKALYPEFRDVIDLKDYKTNHSRAIRDITKNMPVEGFTLDFLKKLYMPVKMDDLVSFYGVKNRSSLTYLAESLGIKKLSGQYLQLYKLSDEAENSKFAKKAMSYVSSPEIIKKRDERAAAAHRTPEYRAKKRQEMIDFYKRNPKAAEKVSLISRLTWDNCPEVKEAFAKFRENLSGLSKKVLIKGLAGEKLSESERRIFSTSMKNFWGNNPEMKALYRERRIEVVKKMNSDEL